MKKISTLVVILFFATNLFPQAGTTAFADVFYKIPLSDSKECIFYYLRNNNNFIEEEAQEPNYALLFDEYFAARIVNPIAFNNPDSSFIYAWADRIKEISGQLVSGMYISFSVVYYFSNIGDARAQYKEFCSKFEYIDTALCKSYSQDRENGFTEGKAYTFDLHNSLYVSLDTFNKSYSRPSRITLIYTLPKSLYPTNTLYVNDYCEPYYLSSDIAPEFVGGMNSLMNFLKVHQKKNDTLKTTEAVIISFFINRVGEIIYPKIISRSAKCPACNDEALRLVKLMPKWEPGKQIGYNNVLTPVITQFSLPFTFNEK